MRNNILRIFGKVLLMSILFSCQSSPVDKNRVYTIDLNSPESYLPLSSFVSNIHSLKLELPSPHFWGVVSEVVLKDNNYFIVDKKQNKIFRFTKDGIFLNTIGARGQGPGEYVEVSNFFVDESSAFICDIGTNTVYHYSFDGTILKTIKIPASLVFDDITALPDGRFLCHRPSDDENSRGIWIMDQTGEKIKRMVEYKRGNPYVYSDWNTLYAGSNQEVKIFNQVDGSYYQMDLVNDTVVKVMRLKANRKMLVDLECLDREMLHTKEKCAYSLFTVDGNNYVLSLWSLIPENQRVWTICRKTDGKVDIGTFPKMDIPGYSEMGRPVSSNIPNTLVTVYTDEFSKDMFPDNYKNMDLNESIAVLSLLEFK